MEVLVTRNYKKSGYTIGSLFIDGEWMANTLEDTDRGLTQDMPVFLIKTKKVFGETAIPSGKYEIQMDQVSPKYSKKAWYYSNCNGGRLPRLKDVPGFDGILIHSGNTAKDTHGCILVGKNDVKGGISHSREYFLRIYTKLMEAYKKNESIVIEIG